MRSLSLRDPGFVGSFGKDEFPIGGIIMWSSATIPAGWAVCNGSNGTPDLRDRFVPGAGSSYAVGATGGANSVTLTTAQLPGHTHSRTGLSTSTDANHTHGHSANSVSQGRIGGNDGQFVNNGGTTSSSTGGHTHAISGTSAAAGGGNSHENRPPYHALNYIMRLS